MYNVFVTIEVLIIAMAMVIGIYQWKHLTTTLRVVCVQTVIGLLTEVTGLFAVHAQISTTPLMNVYVLVESLLFIYAAYRFGNAKRLKYMAVSFAVVLMIVWAVNIYVVAAHIFVNWAFLTGAILISALYVYILLFAIHDQTNLQIRKSTIWLCCGFVFYYSCNIPLFAFLNYLIKAKTDAAQLYFTIINVMLSIFRHVAIAVAFISMKREQKMHLT